MVECVLSNLTFERDWVTKKLGFRLTVYDIRALGVKVHFNHQSAVASLISTIT